MTPSLKNSIPWLVRAHHGMRTLSFGMVFGATALHVLATGHTPLMWALLALLLIVYPQVQYWRAVRSPHPIRTELRSLTIDSVLLGMYVGGMGFSQWLSYSVLIGTLTNNVVNRGWRGLAETLVAMPLGIGIWVLFAGFSFAPQTHWTATLFCMAGLTLYLALMCNIGYARNRQLRRMREQLRQSEKDLLDANEAMVQQLQRFDGLHEQLLEQANHDPLTGLYNRRYLGTTLSRELARCLRDNLPLSLILIDIDHFKSVNDGYGHQAGDQLLIRLAEVFSGIARPSDVVCRYGGEEFLMLVPLMPLEIAVGRAESLRESIGGMKIPFHGGHLSVSISVGVAAYPHHADCAENLIRCADQALYRAKRMGRNRVEVADPVFYPEAASPSF